MDKRISIITPWLGGLHLIPDYERAVKGAQVISVDNGSAPDDADAIRAMTERLGGVYLRNEVNAGFAGANNQGYQHATGDVVIFLNSDIAGDPAWLKQVVADVHDGALYGPALMAQIVYGMRMPYLEGWCVAATRATWDSLGGPWDADAYPGPYWEDNDLCLRAIQAGHSLSQTAWRLKHKGGQSAGSLIKWGDTFERNRATYAERVKGVWTQRQEYRPKIYDCFTFYNELDLLEARLTLLDSVVDTFVIVEATKTFTGQDKPLFYQDNAARFARWAHKIRHIIVDDMPETGNPWDRETHQRNAIRHGLTGAHPADVVIISDVDEFPDPATLPRRIEAGGLVTLVQEFYYYSPRYRHTQPWTRARVTTAAMLRTLTPQQIRDVGYTHSLGNTAQARFLRCGWHLSYFGDVAAIQRKIAAFSHQEYNTPDYTDADHLADCIRRGVDLFGRDGVTLEDLGDAATLPPALLALVERGLHDAK